MEWYTILLSILAIILAIDYLHSRLSPNHFRQHRIPYRSQKSFFETMIQLLIFPKSLLDIVQFLYDIDKEKHPKYIGFYSFTQPILMLRDIDLIKSVCIKNFESFEDHYIFSEEVIDPLFANNLIMLRGDKWRKVRSIMSPSFTSSKMKAMLYPLLNEVAVNFSECLANLTPGKCVMEMKDTFSRYGTDVIATCAFGISVETMKNPKNDFYVYGKRAMNFKPIDICKILLAQYVPALARVLKVSMFDRDTYLFFRNVVADTIRMREEKGIIRPDMIQIMMEGRDKEHGKEMSIETMTSQAFAFFLGGFETSATAMSLITYQIAVFSDVQEKLQEEIDRVMEDTNGQPTYEAINKMIYLDAVINEVLRIYPPTPLTDRLCVKDYELPPSVPGAKPFVVKKGSVVWLPISGIHRDAGNFSDPEKFKPERFLDEKQEGPHNLDAFRPFGLGPRMCIGNRFVLLQIKVILFHLLARCDLQPCEKTQIPLKFKKGPTLFQTESGVWLDVVPREK